MAKSTIVFEVIAIESDSDGHDPYPLRVVCLTKQQGKLVVWGAEGKMDNIQRIREATLPCTVHCIPAEPPAVATEEQGHTAWVHPTDWLQLG